MVEITVAVRMPDHTTKVATVNAHLSGVVLVKCKALTMAPGAVVAVYTVPHINMLSAAHTEVWYICHPGSGMSLRFRQGMEYTTLTTATDTSCDMNGVLNVVGDCVRRCVFEEYCVGGCP